jgi:hypothetical protein
MTRDVIKPGITYDFNDRHVDYDNDNGYMAMGVRCKNREHAAIVESILRSDYRAIRVYGSLEYLHTAGLASLLKVDYDNTSYASYVQVAQALYVRIVSMLQDIWPETYGGKYGDVFNLVECTIAETRKTLSLPSTSDKLELELKHVREEISRSRKQMVQQSTAPITIALAPARLTSSSALPPILHHLKAALQR